VIVVDSPANVLMSVVKPLYVEDGTKPVGILVDGEMVKIIEAPVIVVVDLPWMLLVRTWRPAEVLGTMRLDELLEGASPTSVIETTVKVVV
jgi:hypothetical protein